MQIAASGSLSRTRIFALILVTVEDVRDTTRSTPARIAIFAITLFLASMLFGTRELQQPRTTLKRTLTCGLIALAFWIGGQRTPSSWSAMGFTVSVILTAIGAAALFRR